MASLTSTSHSRVNLLQLQASMTMVVVVVVVSVCKKPTQLLLRQAEVGQSRSWSKVAIEFARAAYRVELLYAESPVLDR